MSQQFEVDFDQEFSDVYQEVVHVHFEEKCPVCQKEHAGTSMYFSVSDVLEIDKGLFSCENCNTQFKILNYECAREPFEATIEVIGNDNCEA